MKEQELQELYERIKKGRDLVKQYNDEGDECKKEDNKYHCKYCDSSEFRLCRAMKKLYKLEEEYIGISEHTN